nr:Anoctamin-7 [Polyrhizophydium stewartii]
MNSASATQYDKNVAQLRKELGEMGLENRTGVHMRDMMRTIALFGHRSNATLFDHILEWSLEHPGADSMAAMNEFAGERNADAVVKLLYSRSSSLWDAILHYHVKPGEDATKRIGREPDSKTRNEIRAAHMVGLLRRGLILVLKISEFDDNERFIKVIAPFDVLCREAERVQLRMQLDLSKLLKEVESGRAAGVQVVPEVAPTFIKRLSGMFGSRNRREEHIDTNDLRDSDVSIYWEGPSSLFYDGAISAKRSALFSRERLDMFKGGDISQYGLQYVHFKFFSNARRNMLVHSIVASSSIILPIGWSDRSNVDDLLLAGVYKSFYAVHDGPLLMTGSAVEHVDASGDIKTMTPHSIGVGLHTTERNLRAEIYQGWRESFSWRKVFSYLPVSELREYYGERVGFYFAWLGYYTIWCQSAAIIGLVAFAYGLYRGLSISSADTHSPDGLDTASEWHIRGILMMDNEAAPIYAFLMSVWAVLLLEFWKRQTESVAFLWDVSDYRRRERIRPQWRPSGVRKSPITGKDENFESARSKWLTRFVTSTLIGFSILLILGMIAGLIAFKDYFTELGSSEKAIAGTSRKQRILNVVYSNLSSFSVSIFAVIQILVIDPIYMVIAHYLNDWDNYRTVSEYEDNLIIKGFLLSFLSNFALIIHTAVLKAVMRVSLEVNNVTILDFGRWDSNCEIISSKFGMTNCMSDLIIQVATMFVFRQFLLQALDVMWPLVSSRYRDIMSLNFDFDFAADDSKNLPQYVRDSKLAELTEGSYTDDFSSKVIQFGFLTMFSAAFPLAPVFAYINNLVEMRVDVWKYLAIYQRPFARRASSIGQWETIMKSIVAMGVLFNALIIAFASSWFQRFFNSSFPETMFTNDADGTPNVKQRAIVKVAVQLAFVLVFEHAVFLVSVFVDYIVPDVPQSVMLGHQAEEYLERMQNVQHEQRMEEEARANAAAATQAAVSAAAAISTEAAVAAASAAAAATGASTPAAGSAGQTVANSQSIGDLRSASSMSELGADPAIASMMRGTAPHHPVFARPASIAAGNSPFAASIERSSQGF